MTYYLPTHYGQWAGNPDGVPADLEKCREEVYPCSGWSSHQCRRRPGHGRDGRYCKQHSKRHPRPDPYIKEDRT